MTGRQMSEFELLRAQVAQYEAEAQAAVDRNRRADQLTPEQLAMARVLCGEIERSDGRHWLLDVLGWSERSQREAVMALRAVHAERLMGASWCSKCGRSVLEWPRPGGQGVAGAPGA